MLPRQLTEVVQQIGRRLETTGWGLASLLVLGPACDQPGSDQARQPPPGPTGGPSLSLVDSVVLAEPDPAFLAQPASGFSVDSTGDLFIPDDLGRRLHRFGPDGQLRQVYGRPGRGPGEFHSMGVVTLFWDSVVIQPSGYLDVCLFDRGSGTALGRQRVRGYVTSGAVLDGRMYLGAFDHVTRRAVAVIPVEDLLSTSVPDSVPHGSVLVTLPSEYDEYPQLDAFSLVHIAGWGDTLVTGFSGLNRLMVSSKDGRLLDTLDVPVRLRRGVTAKALERFRSPGFHFARAVESISSLSGLWRLPDGHLLLWHQDRSVVMRGPQISDLTGVAWLSLLSPDRRSACVDSRLPDPSSLPRLAVRADTVYALDQVVLSTDPPSSRTVIRRYRVTPTGCRWVPLR